MKINKKTKKAREELREIIFEKEKKGILVLRGFDCYLEIKLDDIIKQPVEGILYDLNRDRVTVLSFIDDPKWVNDYAVGLVITKLHGEYKKYLEVKDKFYSAIEEAEIVIKKTNIKLEQEDDVEERNGLWNVINGMQQILAIFKKATEEK